MELNLVREIYARLLLLCLLLAAWSFPSSVFFMSEKEQAEAVPEVLEYLIFFEVRALEAALFDLEGNRVSDLVH